MMKPPSAVSAVPILLFAMGSCAAIAACGGSNPASSTSGPATSSGNTNSTDPATTSGAGATGATGGGGGTMDTGGGGDTTTTTTTPPAPKTRKTMTGDATWQVTFDDAAKMAGAKDCSYTRHYEAVEDRSAPWLCPSCEVIYTATVKVTAGLADCYSQVSKSPPNPQEWLGYGNGKWFRSGGGPTTEQGTAMVDATSVVTANKVDNSPAAIGGNLSFVISGNLTLGEAEGDPLNGFEPPDTYKCGWPKANPPAYTGDYSLAKNGVLPDGLFKDACDETVRLHDFKGKYLVVDMSAMDCPPCQSMASEEEKFVADMAAKGVEVEVVTLLAPSLSNVFGLTTTKNLTTWINKFKLKSAVVADRGWGVSVFEPAIGADNIGYPTWVIVRPDLTVVDFMTGYGGFADLQSIILADKK